MTSFLSPSPAVSSDLQNGVLTLTLHRPDALNAFRPEMLEALALLLGQANGSDEVAVVVLQGSGRAFSAGVDLKVLQGIDPEAGKIGDVFDVPARDVRVALRAVDRPVIAKVHGFCFTGALEIALHCDFIHTTEDTKFGDTHAKFGLRPTWGMSQTLAQAVGVRRAKELSFTGRTFTGVEAERWGLANASWPDRDTLDREVQKLADKIAANSRAAVAAMKDLYGLAQDGLGLDEALDREGERTYPGIADTADRLAGF